MRSAKSPPFLRNIKIVMMLPRPLQIPFAISDTPRPKTSIFGENRPSIRDIQQVASPVSFLWGRMLLIIGWVSGHLPWAFWTPTLIREEILGDEHLRVVG
jgi:hypothetical protein